MSSTNLITSGKELNNVAGTNPESKAEKPSKIKDITKRVQGAWKSFLAVLLFILMLFGIGLAIAGPSVAAGLTIAGIALTFTSAAAMIVTALTSKGQKDLPKEIVDHTVISSKDNELQMEHLE